MTVKLELTPEVEANLLEQARLNGLTLERFAEQVLRERAETPAPAESSGERFWKGFMRQVHTLPDAVFEHLPEDGASEHDHYLYGAAKRNK